MATCFASALVATPFADGVNALCWARSLAGDFNDVVTQLGPVEEIDTLGAARVESVIGVEPSGEPINSIRLNAENHPFNPMVNAGAIACSGRS